jgi:DNA-binding transcriptional LysR family regulator
MEYNFNSENRLLFKNYEYFITIIEEGGVSKAAEKLFISQSAVSKYVKRLEDAIGIKLFNRESYPLNLSEAGELYYRYIKNIVAQEKELKTEITNLKEGIQGLIKIGIAVWHSSIFFPVVFPVFGKLYPNIHIEAYEGTSQEVNTMIEHDKVDFALFQLPSSYDNIAFEHLSYERILFAVNKNNPLLQFVRFKAGLPVNAMSKTDFLRFSTEPFILMKTGQNSRALSQLYLNKVHLKPNTILETMNVSTVINMVKAGAGVAFIPEAALMLKENTEDIFFFQIDDPPLRRELGIAYKATGKLRRQDELFIDTLREIIHD